MVKQVADFGRELVAAFVIAGVLRRDDRLGGLFADFLEYLVEAAVEQVARVGAFGSLVPPLLDKFEEVLKLYPQIHRGDVDQRDLRLHSFKYRAILLFRLFRLFRLFGLFGLFGLFWVFGPCRLFGLRRFDVLRAAEKARSFAGVTGRPVRADPHQQRVSIAIQAQIDDSLSGARGRPFMPELPPRTAPKPGLTRLQSLCQTLGVHVRDHQDFITVVILYDGSDQSAFIKLQILNQQL